MPFLIQGKTNWKYILIVVILAVGVGGGTLIYQYRWMLKEKISFPPVVKKPTLLPEVYKKSRCYCATPTDCYPNYNVITETQYWECSENRCSYQCIETTPIQFPPGTEGISFCTFIATSIGWPPPLKGGKIEDNSVLLEWASVSEESAIEFNVYRKIASEEDVGKLDNKILSDVYWERIIRKPENLYDVIKNENVTLFIDKEVEEEKTYLYAITGTDRFCHEGNFIDFFIVEFPDEVKIWKMGKGGVLVWKSGQDWKTHQSSKMGFSIKSPADFKVSLDIPVLDVISRSGLFTSTFIKGIPFEEELIRVEIDSWTELPEAIWGKGFTFQDWIDKEMEDYRSRWDPQLKREDSILDNNPAVKISYTRSPILDSPYKKLVIRIYTQKGEKMYRISIWIDSEKQDTYLPIFNQMLSTFRFIETISIWPDVESFDLINKNFEGKIWTKEQKVKILTTDSTKFYRTAGPSWEKEFFTFSEFYSLLQNWGPPWPFTAKGFYEEENTLKADEVFFIAQ